MYWLRQSLFHHCCHPSFSVTQGKFGEAYQLENTAKSLILTSFKYSSMDKKTFNNHSNRNVSAEPEHDIFNY